MNDAEFRVFLQLLMVSDPWPLEEGYEVMTDFANAEAQRHGHPNWPDAYHALV